MSYTLCSSYFEGGKPFRREFHDIWRANNLKLDIPPVKTVVIVEGGVAPENEPDAIVLTGNLGHVGQLLSGEKNYDFSGWSASMCAGALLAYTNGTDMIYKEEDCLTFGPVVHQAYEDMGDGMIVFGGRHTSPPWMQCSQSFFLVRHSFIPTMVSQYLGMGKDGDKNNLGERKFEVLQERLGSSVVKHLSFGVDRQRPIPYHEKVFYAQQFKPQELEDLRKAQLI